MPKKPSAPRTEFRGDETIALNCECGATLVMPGDRAKRIERIRCKRCGRAYKKKADGTYFMLQGVLKPTDGHLSPAQAAQLLGVGQILSDPGDWVARIMGLARQFGVLPQSPMGSALDRLRGAWIVVKQRTPEIDQEAAYEVDRALNELEAWRIVG